MTSKLIAQIETALQLSAEESFGEHQGGGDFANVGFALGAAYSDAGNIGWSVYFITRKDRGYRGTRRRGYFKWRNFASDPDKLAMLLRTEYERFCIGLPHLPDFKDEPQD
jgi:hypothetical protein